EEPRHPLSEADGNYRTCTCTDSRRAFAPQPVYGTPRRECAKSVGSEWGLLSVEGIANKCLWLSFELPLTLLSAGLLYQTCREHSKDGTRHVKGEVLAVAESGIRNHVRNHHNKQCAEWMEMVGPSVNQQHVIQRVSSCFLREEWVQRGGEVAWRRPHDRYEAG
ncbi:unnamed protein product, partial [Ectocarpus sp. 6 AP-2014]